MPVRHVAKLSVVAVAAVALSGCFWSQPGFGPAKTRYNPNEDVLTPASMGDLHEQWSAEFPNGAPLEVVSDGSRLYMTTRMGNLGLAVEARNPGTGQQLWTRTLSPESSGSPSAVALSGDHLALAYFSSGAADPDCATAAYLDPATGAVVHSAPSRQPASSMVTTGSTVARLVMDSCSSSFGTLVVEDRDTMATLWTAPVGPISGIQGDLVLADGRIYVSTGSSLAAFPLDGCGASTCPPLWTKNTGSSFKLWGRAADRSLVVSSVVTLRPPDPNIPGDPGSFFGVVSGLDGATGNALRRSEIHGDHAPDDASEQAMVNRVVIAGDVLGVTATRSTATPFVPTHDLVAIPSGGCGPVCPAAWTAPLDAEGQEVVGAGDVIYVGVGEFTSAVSHLEAFARTGCGATVCSALTSIQVDGGVEYMSTSNGRVFLVTISATGRTLHAFGVV